LRIQSAITTITRSITVAAGVYAPGHLGELTQYVPFELVEAVLSETGRQHERLRALPSRVGVYFVLACATRRGVFEWRCETVTVGSSQRPDRSWGQPDPGSAGEGGSSPDNDGTGRYCQTVRVRLARPVGVTEVNQWWKPRNRSAGSNLVDPGRCAVRERSRRLWSTPKPCASDGGEATLNACGVGVAMLPGYS
jgi:transposase IS4-like protein